MHLESADSSEPTPLFGVAGQMLDLKTGGSRSAMVTPPFFDASMRARK